ncbi:MAG: amino-acid N-acetyltransferase, partial [Gammaproteobacteria bacterium]|nr:amino-acid N-acetyltransferase [Gammaproteobacteria bacterium]
MPEIDNQDQFIKWFRHSSPYINAHRGKIFVILFDGDTVNDDDFPSIIHDIALLNSLGIKLVLVHGARPQINSRLLEKKLDTKIINQIRVTDEQALNCVKEAVGSVKMKIEAMLSMGVANSPMAGARIRVVSGNYVMAKPYGIHDGVDYCFTGEVRRVDAHSIHKQLNDNAVVLLSSTAYSPTGEIFSLTAEEVATRTAIALAADKFIHLSENVHLTDENHQTIHQMTLSQAKKYLLHNLPDEDVNSLVSLKSCIAVCSEGVKRAHIINRHTPGALLLELFSRNGIGTLITEDNYDLVRQAKIDDVGGIFEIIEPLEREGILVRRSREI